MNHIEIKQRLLYAIYEGGMPLKEAVEQLVNVKDCRVDRVKLREMVEWYMDLNPVELKDNEHYLLKIPAIMVNHLCNHVETLAKGGKVDMPDNCPSVW